MYIIQRLNVTWDDDPEGLNTNLIIAKKTLVVCMSLLGDHSLGARSLVSDQYKTVALFVVLLTGTRFIMNTTPSPLL